MTISNKSLLGLHWQKKSYDQRLANFIKQRFDLSETLSQIIAAKEIPLDEIENFLDPKIKNLLPNPFDLGNMEKAVNHVIKTITQQKKITIFADYDVDGAASASLLKRFFTEIGVEVGIYVPDRILEGYGPNVEALLNLKENGSDLVITVDCGTVAFAPLEAAKKAGLEVVVIDHHLGVVDQPEAIAIINPNLLNEKFPHKNLCAAAVSFLFIVAVNKYLREMGFYDKSVNHLKSCHSEMDNKICKNGGANMTNLAENSSQLEGFRTAAKEPNLFNFLDLVALGTVCDVMPLTGLNRAFVSAGLKVLKQRKNLGLRQISDLAALSEELTAYSLGFVIGPRINAGGRVGKSDLGAKILSSENEEEIHQIAQQLEIFNQQRKNIEAQVLDEAVQILKSGLGGFSTDDPIIFATAKNWHQGVIGIVASRLKELYNKPVAVIAIDEDGKKGKASCRSISGIDFGAEILKARLEGLIIEGGGHAMAGGFSVLPERISDLHRFFCDNLGEKITKLTSKRTIEFAAALDLEQVNVDFLKELAKLEPFGTGNHRPKFILRNLQKVRANLVGQKQDHINCIFTSKNLIGFNGQIQAVAFRAAGTILAEILLDPKFNKPINLAGSLNINSWMGIEKLQMVIEDILL